MEQPSRYIIGIDLGTTNSAVSYCDTTQGKGVRSFSVPQITRRGTLEALPVLPSFCYIRSASDFVVGEWAREEGALTPTRLVSSAKSWLCHAGANRKDRLLPRMAEETGRISPVEATRRYLDYLRVQWDKSLGDLENQEVVLTVPASFDEVARALTVQAATEAGFRHLTLVEEPLAAFYQWLARHETEWKSLVHKGDLILVCDVGGGTTDFTLIEVEEEGFRRLCVGDHLLLGGDNMDQALAHHLETKLERQLEPYLWHQLVAQARQAKELLLSGKQDEVAIRIKPRGSQVVAGTISTSISGQEVRRLLGEGFFGLYDKSEALQLRRRTGIKTMGLPFEEEPSVTKHLARFLFTLSQCDRCPRFVLFNGGSMKPQAFQQAIVDSLANWYQSAPPQILASDSLDLAVSRGATYYGLTRRGEGQRIAGGTPRAYYLKIDVPGQGAPMAITLLPRGSEEGSQTELPQSLSALPNKPVSFQLYSSHTRLHDRSGELVSISEEELNPLPLLQTVLHFGKGQDKPVPVRLGINLTPVGTMQLWLQAVNTDHRWNLEFQVRGSEGQEAVVKQPRVDETRQEGFLNDARKVLKEALLSKGKLMESLEKALAQPRKDWSVSTLRGLWDEAIQYTARDERWWNLIGFTLRPGFGFPMDDFRIKQLWKFVLADFKTVVTPDCQLQKWICFRRIAGGLNKGQQQQLASDLFQGLDGRVRNRSEAYLFAEKVRLLASLELLENSAKKRLGELLLTRLQQGQAAVAEFWALGRLGARHLFHGSSAHVLPVDICERWIEQLLSLKNPPLDKLKFVFEQLARKTAERHLNVSVALVDRILSLYEDERLRVILTEVVALNHREEEDAFGEALPAGVILVG